MANYIDAFVLPIPKIHLETYQSVTEQVAEVWKEYGAIAYYEYMCDDLTREGTRSFVDAANATDSEAIIFGWVVFDSRESRDLANEKVPQDPKMAEIVGPLVDLSKLIFDASRMVYGGFRPLVESEPNS